MFMPHGMCFSWRYDILALHVSSDAFIAIAYFCIPALIIVYVRPRPALWRVAIFFSIFIISCGSTHLAEIWTVWHPDYWLSGTLKAITAVASVATVISLLPVMPYARGLNRLLDVDRINAQLEQQSKIDRQTRNILDTVAQILAIHTEDLSVEYLSPQWFAYTGAPARYGLGSTWLEYIHPDDRAIVDEQFARLIDERERTEQYEMRLRGCDGTFRWFLVRTVALPPTTGTRRRWLTTSTDIDDLKRTQRALAKAAVELEHLAYHDPLTKLPNRTGFVNDLERQLSRAERAKLGLFVMYVDLDNFKLINDGFGHAAGDRVLAEVGVRIADILRIGDHACRIGGDEFAVVCTTSDGAHHAARVAERLLVKLAQPIPLDGGLVTVKASIGISLYPRDGNDVEGLMLKADTAMYAAKEAGRNRYRVFGETTHSPTVAALEFEAELRAAITRNEFVVYFQPIISLDARRVIGAEALVRWQHPRRGLLAPAEFIKVAEANNTIAQISHIVINAACEQLSRFVFADGDPFAIAINISAMQFDTPGIADTLASAIERHNVNPSRIAIEITENLILNTTPIVLDSINAIRASGVRLSIDDFGTGYCSLTYLRRFPMHSLKIDRSFVENIADSIVDQAIARAIISLAHTMSMSVIAEGVESAAQLGRLRTLGCDYVQGFFISQPLHSADFEDFLFRFDRGATRHPTTRRIPCIIDEDGPTRPALALAAFDEVFDVTERRGGESGTARH